MGGSGGGRYISPWSSEQQKKIDQAREKESQNLRSDIDALLKELLARYNDRDTEATRNKLDKLAKVLGAKVEIDQVLFAGSVAKYTAIEGISDVDALVIIDDDTLMGKSPAEFIRIFASTLNTSLPRSEIESISTGRLAVTIKYTDDTEIQLLPALRSRNNISIASEDGKDWKVTKPKIVKDSLIKANQAMNQNLIPSIKLFKSINFDFPRQKQLTGYHIESMSIEAVKNYDGPKTPRDLLIHLLGYSCNRVLKPMQDKTGQSRNVDDYLGKAESIERKNISQTLIAMKRRLESSTNVSQWRNIFEE